MFIWIDAFRRAELLRYKKGLRSFVLLGGVSLVLRFARHIQGVRAWKKGKSKKCEKENMEGDKVDHGANASTSRHELTPHEYGLRAMLNSYEFSPMAPITSGADVNAQSRVISRILADTLSPARGGVEIDERRAASIYARSLPLGNDTIDNVLAMIDRREEQVLVREMATQLRNELASNAPLLIDRPEALEQAAIEAIDVDEVANFFSLPLDIFFTCRWIRRSITWRRSTEQLAFYPQKRRPHQRHPIRSQRTPR